jgi:hypothetical protein
LCGCCLLLPLVPKQAALLLLRLLPTQAPLQLRLLLPAQAALLCRTMMESVLDRMSSKFCTPSWFSTLLMILMNLPFSPSTWAPAGVEGELRHTSRQGMLRGVCIPSR